GPDARLQRAGAALALQPVSSHGCVLWCERIRRGTGPLLPGGGYFSSRSAGVESRVRVGCSGREVCRVSIPSGDQEGHMERAGRPGRLDPVLRGWEPGSLLWVVDGLAEIGLTDGRPEAV